MGLHRDRYIFRNVEEVRPPKGIRIWVRDISKNEFQAVLMDNGEWHRGLGKFHSPNAITHWKHLSPYDMIDGESEDEYLDNGGALSLERRDHYFTRAMSALKEAEAELRRIYAGQQRIDNG